MGFLLLALLFCVLAYAHWIGVPAKIEAARQVGRRMPTRQFDTFERVRALESYQHALRWAMVAAAVTVFLALRST